jgi:hypothetical protein
MFACVPSNVCAIFETAAIICTPFLASRVLEEENATGSRRAVVAGTHADASYRAACRGGAGPAKRHPRNSQRLWLDE